MDETIEELEFAIRAENEGGKATWMECFSTRNALWKRTINGMMLECLQPLHGQSFYCKRCLSFVAWAPDILSLQPFMEIRSFRVQELGMSHSYDHLGFSE